jgi:hypothetical protein
MLVALHRDAELLSHGARITVACGEICGPDDLAVFQPRLDMVGVLDEVLQTAAVAQRDRGELAHLIDEDAVEHELRAMREIFRALRDRRRVGDRRHADAGELVAGEARDEDIVEGEITRKAPVAHPLGYAPAPAELHRANTGGEHLRVDDAPVALLDERAGDAAAAELDGQGEAHRPAAHDQYRNH